MAESYDLLVPIFRGGKLVYEVPEIEAARACARKQLASLSPATRHLDNPQPYQVGLEASLDQLRSQLIAQNKAQPRDST